MSQIENISYLSKKHLDKIKRLTSSLQSQFDITYFARQSVSYEGHWEILGNLPDWLDYSAAKKFYNIDPSLLHPDHYQAGLTVISSPSVPDFLKNMANECLQLYNIDHSLCILNKNITGCEWYFFATSAKNTNIISTYITQISSIYRYIQFFKKEAQSLLWENLDYRINISTLKNKPFYSKQDQIDLAPFTFVDDEHSSINGKNISSREKECLLYLIDGKTIKETAKALALSPRTVEEYLKRLKQKTGCKYKRELISLFK